LTVDDAKAQQPSPFLKWAGGKRWLLDRLLPLIDGISGTYFEPFLGAGAVLLSLSPRISKVGADTNSQLIDTWTAIRDELPNVLEILKTFENNRDAYYEIRAWDRDPEAFNEIPRAHRAARLLYLNKTCFNGLYRENKKGQFNVPFGNYAKPNFLDEDNLWRVQQSLKATDSRETLTTDLKVANFEETVKTATEGDVVYFDPPYEPLSPTASFTGYQGAGFSSKDQRILRDIAVELKQRGARVILSNSSAPLIHDLYAGLDGFTMEEIPSKRAIAARANGRKTVNEFLIIGEKP